jgi:RNase adaptor protein for sRNA GlmZ degradation
MPRGPKGERRPRDVIGNAVHVMRIATGQITDDVPTVESEGKDPAAVALGRKGGKARAEAISARKRRQIAKKAAASRWKGR